MQPARPTSDERNDPRSQARLHGLRCPGSKLRYGRRGDATPRTRLTFHSPCRQRRRSRCITWHVTRQRYRHVSIATGHGTDAAAGRDSQTAAQRCPDQLQSRTVDDCRSYTQYTLPGPVAASRLRTLSTSAPNGNCTGDGLAVTARHESRLQLYGSRALIVLLLQYRMGMCVCTVYC